VFSTVSAGAMTHAAEEQGPPRGPPGRGIAASRAKARAFAASNVAYWRLGAGAEGPGAEPDAAGPRCRSPRRRAAVPPPRPSAKAGTATVTTSPNALRAAPVQPSSVPRPGARAARRSRTGAAVTAAIRRPPTAVITAVVSRAFSLPRTATRSGPPM